MNVYNNYFVVGMAQHKSRSHLRNAKNANYHPGFVAEMTSSMACACGSPVRTCAKSFLHASMHAAAVSRNSRFILQ